MFEAYLWETDFIQQVAVFLKRDPAAVNREYPQLVAYYAALGEQGNQYLNNLNAGNFSLVYPQLLAVDAKCRLLFESYPFFLKSPTDQEALIAMVERDYLLAHQEQFRLTLEWYEQESIGCLPAHTHTDVQ